MNYERATSDDCQLLGKWNKQLIDDEGHRNEMSISELVDRMQRWITDEYTAMIFSEDGEPVAYGVYRETEDDIYLRQFFVRRDMRHENVGSRAMSIFEKDVWPVGKRVTLEVLWENEAAWEFWKSNGYGEYSVTLDKRI